MEQGNPVSVGTVVTGETPLPNWLSCPDPKPPRPSKERLALEQTQYEIVFQTVIEQMCEGITLTAALQSFPHDISRGKFRQWITKDPSRRQLLDEAEKLLGECLFDDFVELNRKIGEDLMDIESFKVKSQNLKWLLQVYNKKRFGETKQVDATFSISVIDAINAGNARVINAEVVDVTPRLRNSDD